MQYRQISSTNKVYGAGSRGVKALALPKDTRRQTLIQLGAGILSTGLFASEASAKEVMIKIKNLSSPQVQAELEQLVYVANAQLDKGLSAADASPCMRLLLQDAASFDPATGYPGVNGSCFLGELKDSSLQPIVAKLRAIKEKIDQGAAGYGNPPLTYADLTVLAARAAVRKLWLKQKSEKSKVNVAIVEASFGTDFPVSIGRVDGTGDELVNVDIPTSSTPIPDIKLFFDKLGNSKYGQEGFLMPKPPFNGRRMWPIWTACADDPVTEGLRLAENDEYANYTRNYTNSLRTITRTEYETNFVEAFTILSGLGTKVKTSQYLYEMKIELPDIK